jgi:hypothetical protein
VQLRRYRIGCDVFVVRGKGVSRQTKRADPEACPDIHLAGCCQYKLKASNFEKYTRKDSGQICKAVYRLPAQIARGGCRASPSEGYTMRQSVQRAAKLPMGCKQRDNSWTCGYCHHSGAREDIPAKAQTISVLDLRPLFNRQSRALALKFRDLACSLRASISIVRRSGSTYRHWVFTTAVASPDILCCLVVVDRAKRLEKGVDFSILMTGEMERSSIDRGPRWGCRVGEDGDVAERTVYYLSQAKCHTFWKLACPYLALALAF